MSNHMKCLRLALRDPELAGENTEDRYVVSHYPDRRGAAVSLHRLRDQPRPDRYRPLGTVDSLRS